MAEAPLPDETALNSGAEPVEERHRFDEASLARWMAAHVEGFEGPMQVFKFKGGQSNPTFLLQTPKQSYVMRRKPPGKLLPSAHAVDREFKVISALHPTGFPVARPYGLCTDESVIGTMFYVMDNVRGRIIWDGSIPGIPAEERRKTYENIIGTLAKLHATDYQAIGLGDYGKPGSYFLRQIDRWSKQYKLSETETIPEMDKLIDWLPKNIPAGETTSIVHGDYRIDNMILHQSEPRVLAVIDWELSTLGDPLGDFTYYLMNWVTPANGRAGLSNLDLKERGIPNMQEVIDLYCEKVGRAKGIENVDYYFAYNQFRLAGILQGIVGRVRDGTANSANAVANASRVIPLARSAYAFAQKAGMA